MNVAVVTPVYRNASTLEELSRRLGAALDAHSWTLRFVIDASPDASLAVAEGLAAADARLRVTALARNAGQNRALLAGLAEPAQGASAWVCLDADLQDPPEALPALLGRLARGDAGVVFAGRRGAYESRVRLFTGAVHRAALARLTGLPPDAGAFLAMDRPSRDRLLALDPPGIVAGVGAAGLRCESLPVERAARPSGTSAWTAQGRVGQSARSLAWAWRTTSSMRRNAGSGGPRGMLTEVVSAVVFDIGGVLLEWDPRLVYRDLLPDPADLDRFLAEVCTPEWNAALDAGRSFDEACAELASRHPDHAELVHAWKRQDEMIAGEIAGTAELVERLHDAGVPLYLLTNMPADVFAARRARYPVLQRFDGAVVSGEEGVLKPSPEIFAILHHRYRLDPAATLFVDDMEANVAGALSAGFLGHLFVDAPTLAASLGDHGLAV